MFHMKFRIGPSLIFSILSIVLVSLLIPLQVVAQMQKRSPDQPTHLSVNLLTHADQVFLNGYPVNTPLHEAVSRRETFQYADIGQRQPFFGWVVNSNRNNTLQTAYQIVVSSSLKDIEKDSPDMWDSGKVNSDQSINVYYEGKSLEPNKVYFWKVRTWNNHGVQSPYSEIRQFKTADELKDYATARYPIQKQDEYPHAIRKLAAANYFLDFNKAAFGRLRVTLEGKTDNDVVTLHLGEALAGGRINRKPGGSIRYSTYELKLKGGWNTYIIAITPNERNTGSKAIALPKYIGDVTPFRYVEIEGYRDEIEKHQVVRESVFYPSDDTESYFTSSDKILNQVWDISKYSMKATSFAGVYVDGDRERIPYEADALINQLGHYGVAREYSIGRYTHEYLIHHATWPTEWIMQSVLMAWYDYLYTGNKQSMEHFYKDLQAKTLIDLADESGFISTRTGKVNSKLLKSIHLKGRLRDIVDWPHKGKFGMNKNEGGETDGFVFSDINTVVNAYHYFALDVMGTISEHLGKADERDFFHKRAEKLKNTFNEQLIDPKRKIYVDGVGTDHASLHANMFPLAFGLAPQENIEQINRFIRSRGMACSVYGSQFLMDAVYDGHNGAYGLALLTSTSDRSWYNMIRAGSTITMEAWDNKYKPNQDWNHAWGGAPANIIPRKLMGIEPLIPGFGKIRIKPQPADLKTAEIKHPTIRGDVFVSFENNPGKSFKLEITIPANTTAQVHLPKLAETQTVQMNGRNVKFADGKQFIVIDDVGSGRHTFTVTQ